MKTRMRMPRGWLAVLIGLVSFGACRSDSATSGNGNSATISGVSADAGAANVLSATITFTVHSADSARVRYRAAGDTVQATPFVRVFDGASGLTVLGLRPLTSYQFSIEAVGRDGAPTIAGSAQLVTADLPVALQGVTLAFTGTTPGGYLLTAVNRDSQGFIVVFRRQGDVAWYHGFQLRDGEQAQETKQTVDGSFTVYLGGSFGWQPTGGRYVEVRPDGEIVRAIAGGAPYYTDNHELVLTGIDSVHKRAHLFGYDLRRVDMTAYGGPADALIAGHTILRQTLRGDVEFFWSAWDHFAISDWIEPPDQNKQLANIDFDHPNSLDFDHDSNYIISFRNLGEITKIDAVTGAVLWRLGGAHNQFTILNDALNGFSGQHSVRILENGNLLAYDNGLRHVPPESRAVEYRLDQAAMTATLVWEYRHAPAVFTPFLGSVQRLQDGSTLVGWGGVGLATWLNSGGGVLWEGRLLLDGQPASFYRLITIPSLYEYQRP